MLSFSTDSEKLSFKVCWGESDAEIGRQAVAFAEQKASQKSLEIDLGSTFYENPLEVGGEVVGEWELQPSSISFYCETQAEFEKNYDSLWKFCSFLMEGAVKAVRRSQKAVLA